MEMCLAGILFWVPRSSPSPTADPIFCPPFFPKSKGKLKERKKPIPIVTQPTERTRIQRTNCLSKHTAKKKKTQAKNAICSCHRIVKETQSCTSDKIKKKPAERCHENVMARARSSSRKPHSNANRNEVNARR
jgi:hypothetical protein